ncbi:hypothetical protein [Longimicrobium sp.]|uniref:hypothetical protein n=1 Tax=Longimicrobium sp. TaxID=2029185 RepID=UPI002E3669FF|nr:hypothetical protein [Longimicrobium sp.]HEX6036948.1 hypothetical protein [Longimicrobium sp.]
MGGLRFETAGAVAGSAPDRADIACFAGFVARRRAPRPGPGTPYTPLPGAVRAWLREAGWLRPPGPSRPLPHTRTDEDVEALLDLPVPIDSWDVFDRLFAWDARPYPDASRPDDGGGAPGDFTPRDRPGGTYLGAAVRSFFAQGGRRCYVIRVGDPWPFGAPRAERLAALAALVPGLRGGFTASPGERGTWRGIAHLYGLPDVSYLSLPDLADAAAAEPEPLRPLLAPAPPPERFRECSADERVRDPDVRVMPVRAPRCDERGYARWAEVVRLVALMLRGRLREVQLVAALPIPIDGLRVPGSGETEYLRRAVDIDRYSEMSEEAASARFLAGDALLRFLTEGGWMRGVLGDAPDSIASAFVQLVYPWIRTPGSALLPEGMEPGEGALVGMLARNALLRGSFRSAAVLDAGDVWDVFPPIARDQLDRELRERSGNSGPARTLGQRVSLFGPTPRGIRLLSDVTTSRDEAYRPAGVNRLIAAVVRAARRLGEEVTFEASGPSAWRRVEDSLRGLLSGLLRDGALRGESAEAAFQVRCDRSTMTQTDLDAGRMVARIVLQPAAPVEQITVVLGLDEGGAVTLLRDPEREAAA